MLDRGNDNAGKIRLLQSKVYWFENITNKNNIKRLDYTTYEVDLIILYELAKTIVNTFQRLEQAIAMAHHGIVTPNLILPGDLNEILLTAEKEYIFQPLYSMNQRTHYYSLLHSCVLGDRGFVFIPFTYSESLSYFEIRPFPTFINHSLTAQLEVENNVVLLTQDLRYVAFPSSKSLDNECISTTVHEWLCPATNLHFFHSNNHLCLLDVLIQHNGSSHCLLNEVNVTQPVITHMNTFNYLFLPDEMPVTVTCGGHSPIYNRRKGNLVIRDSCGINIPDSLKVFPSHTEHVTQQLNIGEDFNKILPKFSTSHLQDSVMPVDEAEILKDDEDYWWDLDTYPESPLNSGSTHYVHPDGRYTRRGCSLVVS